jgi:hypothetical protein
MQPMGCNQTRHCQMCATEGRGGNNPGGHALTRIFIGPKDVTTRIAWCPFHDGAIPEKWIKEAGV